MRTLRAQLVVPMFLLAAAHAASASEGSGVSAQPSQQPDLQQDAQMAHQHEAMEQSGWMFMQDGILFGNFNRQGSPRGDTEFKVQDWWMGMASRRAGPGALTLTGMLSLDPATVGRRGYSEIFQIGETYKGRLLIDRQHPHDLLMQLAAVWRVALSDRTGLTFAGAPVGEPALGPVAFMHRPSAAENPTAPLGHHTFDSTHISMGVITAALDRGPWVVESSLFHGTEPDDQRWDLMDPGALDSWSARVSFVPSPAWRFQISHGFLKQPERLEPGDIRRTTVSGGWFKRRGTGFEAITLGYGRNDKAHANTNALLLEGTHRTGRLTLYSRLETLQLETEILLRDEPIAHGFDPVRPLTTVTIGGVGEIAKPHDVELGIGADVTFYRVPDVLKMAYGSSPASFHVFLRLRPPVSPMGRMWNMTMAQGMKH